LLSWLGEGLSREAVIGLGLQASGRHPVCQVSWGPGHRGYSTCDSENVMVSRAKFGILAMDLLLRPAVMLTRDKW
jgi:hypothetical protein